MRVETFFPALVVDLSRFSNCNQSSIFGKLLDFIRLGKHLWISIIITSAILRS
ncbi:hypothetical protein ZIOFF_011751 [Zingiber officinale]|uniref:Uncharacterized protein n=1 Tax=Zingiber officinale TaxID=94328 RepID=A0A8J5HKW2_ZINOF|nr:hypothetical protein ZIOFF_011751 [Zingiber officinale]